MKMSKSKGEIKEKLAWVENFSSTQIKLIGFLEVLGALGMVLPMLLKIVPILSPISAAGLAALMIGAIITHAKRKESFMFNLILFALACFVIIGRFILVPIV